MSGMGLVTGMGGARTTRTSRAVARRVPFVRLTAVFGAYVASMFVGAVLFETHAVTWHQLDLDAEWTLFALLSGGLLFAAATKTTAAVRAGILRPSAYALAGLFALMGADEIISIHEVLERHTGIDWQTLYLPVFVAAAIAAVSVIRTMRSIDVLGTLVFFAGCAAWGVSQILEKLQWHGYEHAAHYAPMMITEEILEISGSFAFVLAMLLLIDRRRSS